MISRRLDAGTVRKILHAGTWRISPEPRFPASEAPSRPGDRTSEALATLAGVITGELRSKIDRVWDAFWSGGISNPIEVIEQITYLLSIRRLDDLHTLAERKARVTKVIEDPKFLPGHMHLRWTRFKNDEPSAMFTVVSQQVFPFLRNLGADGSTYAVHMRDARFTISTPQLLSKVVHMLDDVPMDNRDTNGDLYEYMLGKIATAGQNGQFRTPRHIIALMVTMTDPTPDDEILRPCVWYGRVPRRGSRASAPRSCCAVQRCPAPALPLLDVPRIRLRLDHAADRQHENAVLLGFLWVKLGGRGGRLRCPGGGPTPRAGSPQPRRCLHPAPSRSRAPVNPSQTLRAKHHRDPSLDREPPGRVREGSTGRPGPAPADAPRLRRPRPDRSGPRLVDCGRAQRNPR